MYALPICVKKRYRYIVIAKIQIVTVNEAQNEYENNLKIFL